MKRALRILEVIAGVAMLVIGIVSLTKHMAPTGGIIFFGLALWWIIDGVRGLLKAQEVKG